MGIEQRKDIELSSEITGFKGRAVLLGEHMMGPLLRYGLENIMVGADVNYEEGFANGYINGIREGYLPILVGSHQSHVDGVSISLPARTLTDVANKHLPDDQKLKGFKLVLASSLSSGHQGAMMKGFFEEVSPIMERRRLTPLLHTRPQDNQRYHMRTDRFSQYKDLIDAIKNGYAIAVFPEGTTTAGKKNKDGKPNGMQDFMPGSVRMLISAAKDAGKKTMIIPVSITGGPSVHNPDTKLPTFKALKAGFISANPNLLHLYLSNPMKSDEGELERLYHARDWDGLNTVVVDEIEKHLPERERRRRAV
nr:1-acyl-sn-glycerol-3-phosphate acyltransferase [Candidatus Levybacteria bacterium]